MRLDWTWLLENMGRPVPCALCRVPTDTSGLREVTVPGAVIFDGTVVNRVVWVCPRCPG